MNKALSYAFYLVAAVAALFLALEGTLRLAGLPKRTYAHFFLESPGHLYPPSQKIVMTFGPLDYVMTSNSMGFRGPEFPAEKDPSVVRIFAVGDSATDGLFVDDAFAYPRRLEEALRGRGLRVEVINGASGPGSIDEELAIVRKYADRLKPDVAVLLFAMNDVAEIAGKSTEEILSLGLPSGPLPAFYGLRRWFFTETALGEAVFGAKLRVTHPRHAEARREYEAARRGGKYEIEGGGDFRANTQLFLKRFGKTDGMLLADEWTHEAEVAAVRYLQALEEVRRHCAERGIRLAVARMPCYADVYSDTSSRMPETLERYCREKSVPYLDLLPAFRSQGERVLHLAPVDFHLNPEGNRVMAEAIADFLEKEGLAGRRPEA